MAQSWGAAAFCPMPLAVCVLPPAGSLRSTLCGPFLLYFGR